MRYSLDFVKKYNRILVISYRFCNSDEPLILIIGIPTKGHVLKSLEQQVFIGPSLVGVLGA